MEELIEKISTTIGALQTLMEAQLPTLEVAVNDMIQSETKNSRKIMVSFFVLL